MMKEQQADKVEMNKIEYKKLKCKINKPTAFISCFWIWKFCQKDLPEKISIYFIWKEISTMFTHLNLHANDFSFNFPLKLE